MRIPCHKPNCVECYGVVFSQLNKINEAKSICLVFYLPPPVCSWRHYGLGLSVRPSVQMNPLPTTLSLFRDPNVQVVENYSYLLNLRPKVSKS